jgi:hypothetical protein
MLTALRVIAACAVSAGLGYWRMSDPVAPTFQELALLVGVAFFGTLWLTGAFSTRGKAAS